MRPILVTGGSGQLATALADAGGDGVHRAGRPEFDFDRPESIERIFAETAPRLVVNAAAYTGVDAAETDETAAYRANRDGPTLLANLCQQMTLPLIHISTDYVFDGLKGAPYVETDPTSPQCVYGASKLAGEEAVFARSDRVVVLRTSWVYAATGKNFVRTMLAAACKTNRLRVVADQKGCPTAAPDLAAAILAIVRLIDTQGWKPHFHGVFNAAGTGWTTWYGLACAVFEEAARHGLEMPEVTAITTADWPTPARRPPDSRLDCRRLAATFGIALPDWRDALAPVIDAIFAGG
jgi:dTDP-4-dehydrorhamnose reductase